MTALFESFSLMFIHDVFSLLISTYLLFSQIGKPVLDNWPVTFLNTMVKVLSACVAENITHAVEMHGILLRNHLGSRPGCTTTDSLHYVVKFVNNTWRRKEVVRALFLNIKSTFPSIILDWLVHNMR